MVQRNVDHAHTYGQCTTRSALSVSSDYWIQLFVGGLLTNLCFFTGPAIEGYGRYLGIWNIAMSLGLFLAGLFFTSLLAIGFVFVNTR